MFWDCIELIFDTFATVIDGIDVDIIEVGSTGISLWEFILGFFLLAIIFSFFLEPRMGSGLQGIGNLANKSSKGGSKK